MLILITTTAIDSPLVAFRSFVAEHPASVVIITGTPSSTASAHLKRQLLSPSEESLSEMLEEVFEQAEEEESEVTEYLEEVFPDLFGDEEFEAEGQDAKPLKHKNKNKNKNKNGTHSDPDPNDNADGYYDLVKNNRNSTNNGTRGPLLEHAQILSTPVITSLLISFGILLPILAIGVYSLAGIQVRTHDLLFTRTLSLTCKLPGATIHAGNLEVDGPKCIKEGSIDIMLFLSDYHNVGQLQGYLQDRSRFLRFFYPKNAAALALGHSCIYR